MLDLEKKLKTYFGYSEFRPYQKEIIAANLAQKDVLAILPTGAGKSICYQLPALLRPGLAVVISPLISLMQDQVVSLSRLQIPAAFLNSSLSYDEIRSVMESLDTYKLLYIAPERFTNAEFLQLLQKVPISLFAIDEAHCISQWGHSFRTEYRQLSCLKQYFPKTPIIALTATATRDVETDIASQLALENPVVIRASFDRPNLTLRIHPKNDPNEQLLSFLKKHSGQTGIIYAGTRKTVDETYEFLNKKGFVVGKYHAGLSDSQRAQAQNSFLQEKSPLMVATVAFGMGIHKGDIRFIVHMDMPRSIEQYYQEIGRAGRDGLPSECLLLYSPKEIIIYERFAKQIEDLKIRRLTLSKIEKIASLCRAPFCRRKILLRYFGEEYPLSSCGGCDICLPPDDLVDETLSAQKILSCVYRLERPFGINHIIDVLQGNKTKIVMEKGHDRLSTFSLMAEYSEDLLKHLIYALIDQGYLSRSSGEYPVVQWTDLSKKAVRGEVKVMLRSSPSFKKIAGTKKRTRLRSAPLENISSNKIRLEKKAPTDFEEIPKPSSKTKINPDTPLPNQPLFDKLSQLRTELALADKVPSYVIFSNRSLIEMAQKLPSTEEELLQIHGVGNAKCAKYGQAFLDAIAAFK